MASKQDLYFFCFSRLAILSLLGTALDMATFAAAAKIFEPKASTEKHWVKKLHILF